MKIKIILTLLIILFCINNVYAGSGVITTSGGTSQAWSTAGANSAACTASGVFIKDVGIVSRPSTITCVVDGGWSGSADNSKWDTVEWRIGGVKVGTGYFGYNKDDVGHRHVIAYFNSDISLSGYSGAQYLQAYGWTGSIKTVQYIPASNLPSSCAGIGDASSKLIQRSGGLVHTVVSGYSFSNNYNYEIDRGVLKFHLDRDTNNLRDVTIENSTGYSIYDGSLGSTDIDVFNYDTQYKTWNIYTLDYYNNVYDFQITFQDAIPDTNCRIECNDIDIGDNIEVSYLNIDHLRENPLTYGNSIYKTCNINIQIVTDRGYYEELIYQDLIIDENDNTFYYSSNSLTPGTYYAQINRELGGLNEYATRTTFTISEPANYSITVNPDTCYVGDKINIIYKSLNQSTLSVYDDNNKLIDNWLNIQGQSQKIYQVPPDYEYNNAYSDWYVMLNDTGNSSNTYRYNFTVNWKMYIEPEPTPEPIETYYNESVEENIEELKDGFNPIFELIFGISTIFVDNPDYNKDNVVDVNELSTWINSIVSIAIVIFLFILYKVYKRR